MWKCVRLSGLSRVSSSVRILQSRSVWMKKRTDLGVEEDEEEEISSPRARMLDRQDRLNTKELSKFLNPVKNFWVVNWESYNRVELEEWSKEDCRAIVLDRITELQKHHLPLLRKEYDSDREKKAEMEKSRKSFLGSPDNIIKHLKYVDSNFKFKFDPRCEVIVKVYSCGMSVYDWTNVLSPFKMASRGANTGNFLPPDCIAAQTTDVSTVKKKKRKFTEDEYMKCYRLNRAFDEENGVVVGRSFAGVIEYISPELEKRRHPNYGVFAMDRSIFPFKKGDRVMGISNTYTSNSGTMADYIPVYWGNLNSAPEHAPLELCGNMAFQYEYTLQCHNAGRSFFRGRLDNRDVLFLGTGNGTVFSGLFPVLLQGGIKSLTIVLSHERHRSYYEEVLNRFGFGDEENDLFPVRIVPFEGYMDEFLVRGAEDLKPTKTVRAVMDGDHNLNPVIDENRHSGANSKITRMRQTDHLLTESFFSNFEDFDVLIDALSFERSDFMVNMQLLRPSDGTYWVCHTVDHESELYCKSVGEKMKLYLKWLHPIQHIGRKTMNLYSVGAGNIPVNQFLTLARGTKWARLIEKPYVDHLSGRIRPDLNAIPLAIDRVFNVEEAVPNAFNYFHKSDPFSLGENILIEFRKEDDFDPELVADVMDGIEPIYPFQLPGSAELVEDY